MSPYERRLRIIFSLPGRFMLLFVLSCLISESFQSGPFVWQRAVLYSTILGIVVFVSTRGKFLLPTLAPGVSDLSQQWALEGILRSGELPTDPALLQLMPGYIAIRQNSSGKARKRALPLVLIFCSIFFFLAAYNHRILPGVMGVFLLSLGVYNYILHKRILRTIATLSDQLQTKPDKPHST